MRVAPAWLSSFSEESVVEPKLKPPSLERNSVEPIPSVSYF
jgi:hypothetical protein